MIKWIELIPVMCGNYSVGLQGEGAFVIPCLYESKAEVLEEIKDMQSYYDEQIANGEREKGDKWEGEAHKVSWDGDRLFLLDSLDCPIEQINWRKQL